MNSMHGSVPFKHSVVRFIYSNYAKYSIGGVNMGNNGISSMITSMKSTHESVPFKHSVVRLYIAALC